MIAGNRIVALIPARGGSKGLPRKNIRLLGGKPLIAYAIEVAQASELIDRVIVSTEDAEIADVAREFGAEVPFTRPAKLADDNSPEWQVWQHAVRYLQSEDNGSQLEVLVPIPPHHPSGQWKTWMLVSDSSKKAMRTWSSPSLLPAGAPTSTC